MDPRRMLVAGALTVAAVVGLGATQLLPASAPVAHADGLVGYRSCDELLDHYRGELDASVTAWGVGRGGGLVAAREAGSVPAAARQSAASAAGAAIADSAGSADGAVGTGPTGTNLQEQGVDEPDLAKLRDGRLVVLTGNRLRVVSAAAQPVVLGELGVGGRGTYGGELLLVGGRALVVLPGYREDPPAPDVGDDARTTVFRPGTPTTHLALVDLSADQPRLLEESVLDGQYVSARLVDETVRLVTSSWPTLRTTYPVVPGAVAEQEALAANRVAAAGLQVSDVLPRVQRRSADGAVLEDGPAVGCHEVAHARSAAGSATLLVTTMRPGADLAPTDRTAVTTDGDLVYAAEDRLYVATSRWGTVGPVRPIDDVGRPSTAARTDEVSTEIHAFDTTGSTTTSYVGSGTVPGYVLGRWALSRYDGALRVATTRQPPWDTKRADETSSMVVKLAEDAGRLVETGRVEGLGRTERIQAVRYFGDIAAVVTFRQTDPLYLLDLSGTPRVLGELKVPGFSTYLHPIGDGLLLGLGQDADENGAVTGLQVSVFDVSDLTRPTLVDRLRLGQGWAPALDDSRAFSYDPSRRQARFAFTGYQPTASGRYESSAVGITVDESGRLSEAGRLPIGAESWSTRVLVDDDTVFAIGEAGVVSGDADTMTRTGSVRFTRPGWSDTDLLR